MPTKDGDPRKRGLIPFEPGDRWRGNAKGRPKGSTNLTTILKAALAETQIDGQPIAGGKTVAEVLVESIWKNAAKGNASLVQQIWDRLEGKVPTPVVADQTITVCDAMQAVAQAEAAMDQQTENQE